jgi:tetratricopeptide (TPR) repeat protein
MRLASRALGIVLLAGAGALAVRAHPEIEHQLEAAQAAVAASGSDAHAWWRLAELQRYRRHWDEAEAAYGRARTLDPAASLPGIELDLARMRLEAGRAGAALEPVGRYLDRRPDDPEGWSCRGRALEALGRQAEARDAFATGLARSAPTRPTLPDDYLRWARAAEAAGSPAGAIAGGLDEGARRLRGAMALEVAALEIEERHGLVGPALTRLARLEAGAARKEGWAARRARLLEDAGRSAEADAAWDGVLVAIAALPETRREAPAMRALREEALSRKKLKVTVP